MVVRFFVVVSLVFLVWVLVFGFSVGFRFWGFWILGWFFWGEVLE